MILRSILSSLPLLLALGAAHAQSALSAAPSGRATTAVSLSYPRDQRPEGGGAPQSFTISIDYGQPHLRGRALHTDTDSLVMYDEPWRTGANNVTTLKTDVDLTIGGMPVPKGSYFIMTLPSRSQWMLYIQRDAGQGPMEYDPKNDVARIPLRHRALTTPMESLTFWLIPAREGTPQRGELRFAWGLDELSTDWVVR